MLLARTFRIKSHVMKPNKKLTSWCIDFTTTQQIQTENEIGKKRQNIKRCGLSNVLHVVSALCWLTLSWQLCYFWLHLNVADVCYVRVDGLEQYEAQGPRVREWHIQCRPENSSEALTCDPRTWFLCLPVEQVLSRSWFWGIRPVCAAPLTFISASSCCQLD